MGEAMQSRMATVAGARDDLHPDSYADQPMAEPGFSAAPTAPLRRTPAFVADSATVMLRSCAERVRRHTGVEPFVVDLTHPDLGVPAVKVFAPGLRLFRLDAPLFPERDR
jgi:ribosomal protein S12 methylthiotransferase accessory factor